MAQIEADYVNFTIVEHIGKICHNVVNALSCNQLFCRFDYGITVAERITVTVDYLNTHLCHFGMLLKQILPCKQCVFISL